jgi:hypothetical protein
MLPVMSAVSAAGEHIIFQKRKGFSFHNDPPFLSPSYHKFRVIATPPIGNSYFVIFQLTNHRFGAKIMENFERKELSFMSNTAIITVIRSFAPLGTV